MTAAALLGQNLVLTLKIKSYAFHSNGVCTGLGDRKGSEDPEGVGNV